MVVHTQVITSEGGLDHGIRDTETEQLDFADDGPAMADGDDREEQSSVMPDEDVQKISLRRYRDESAKIFKVILEHVPKKCFEKVVN